MDVFLKCVEHNLQTTIFVPSPIKQTQFLLSVIAHVSNLSTWGKQAAELPVWRQNGIHSKLESNLGYVVS